MSSRVKHNVKDEGLMEYDFRGAKRGAVIQRPAEVGKSKVTIRLDDDVIEHYMAEAEKTGGKVGYQTLINQALREGISAQGTPTIAEVVRRTIREEIRQIAMR